MDKELKEQFTMFYEIMTDPELAKVIAKMTKGIFDECVKVGFTEEQALRIVINFSVKKS